MFCVQVRDDFLLLWFPERDRFESQFDIARVERLYQLGTIRNLGSR